MLVAIRSHFYWHLSVYVSSPPSFLFPKVGLLSMAATIQEAMQLGTKGGKQYPQTTDSTARCYALRQHFAVAVAVAFAVAVAVVNGALKCQF